MGIKKASGRVSARRAATFLAALGALVMSSGVALMVTATSADAAQTQHVPVGVCHATSSDTNPYVFIVVDDDSVKLKGHLMHRDNPNKHWKNAGTYELGGAHGAGDWKRDYIADYTGTDGVHHTLDGDITAASCDDKGDVDLPPAVADVDFTDPTCALPNSGSIDTTGDHVEFTIVPLKDAYSIGDQVTVTATAIGDYKFEEDAQTEWPHTFKASDEPCSTTPPVVTPPQTESTTAVSPPKKNHTKTHATVTPTVVEAGLSGATVQDMRGEQGLALTFAGMVMLVLAGGLGLRLRGSATRS
ncbi:MAG TPA: hypothetical protein VF416_10840 [Marmoricola sp.]